MKPTQRLACVMSVLLLGAALPPAPPPPTPAADASTTVPVAQASPAPVATMDPEPVAPATSVVPGTASATEGELARLSRLAEADAARRAVEGNVRNAPGRVDLEAAGLRRCIDASGSPVFTDQRCDTLGAIDAPPEVALPGVAASRITSVRSCARTKADLVDGVRNALEVRDVNRLADYYHWTGMDSASGYRVMERLESFMRRPFIDAQLASSGAPRPFVPARDEDSPGLLSRPLDMPDMPSMLVPPPSRPRRADLLRVDQMRSESDAGAQVTWFHLRSNAGCWWITL